MTSLLDHDPKTPFILPIRLQGTPPILLIGLEPSYADAFREREGSLGHQIIAIDPPQLGNLRLPAAPKLVVVQVGNCDHADLPFDERLRNIPVVFLAAEATRAELEIISKWRPAEIITLPRVPEDAVSRAIARIRDAPPAAAGATLIGESAAMVSLRNQVAAVAPSPANLLITGETGVGKGVVARACHDLSPRSARPFVQVDCTSLASSLIESELFGHTRGAFTGAVGQRKGRFELASDGTIFLDEIGDMEAGLQTKLLRVLHDRIFEPVGSVKTLPMEARVVSATNRNLREMVDREDFRIDLFYRLAVVEIHIPPLRERMEDVLPIADAEIRRLAASYDIEEPELSPSFADALMNYDWPGNVRELLHTLEHALVLAKDGVLECPHTFPPTPPKDASRKPESTWSEISREQRREELAAALERMGGNVARLARELDIPRSTLRYRMRQVGLSEPSPRPQ